MSNRFHHITLFFVVLFVLSLSFSLAVPVRADTLYSSESYYALDVEGADLNVCVRVPFALDRFLIIVCPDNPTDLYGDCTVYVVSTDAWWIHASSDDLSQSYVGEVEVSTTNSSSDDGSAYTVRTSSVKTSLSSLKSGLDLELNFPDNYDSFEYNGWNYFSFPGASMILGYNARESSLVLPMKFVPIEASEMEVFFWGSGQLFKSAVSWVSHVGAAILAQPLLLAFTALPLCGLGIAVFRRLKETV